MIPKNIYYVWVGGKDKPEIFHKCYNSWKQHLPSYNIVEINESNFDLQYHLANNKFFRACYNRKMWAFVSDYMRVIYLYDNGGIYLDTDMEIVQDFSKLINNDTEFFAGFEDDYLINGAILGASKGSPILKSIIEFYNEGIWYSPYFSIPSIITHILNNDLPINRKLKDSYFDKNVKIYPQHYFYPYHYTQEFSKRCITKDTYGIHWWSHSWNKIDDYIFLRTKHMSGYRKKVISFLIRKKQTFNKMKTISKLNKD